MRLLVIGGSGLLGREVVRQARLAGHRVTATAFRRPTGPRLDIRDRSAVAALVAADNPEVVVNAAYLQSDWATTADGGMHVAAAAAGCGARLVHVSSDAVFSGRAPSYAETAAPDPVTPYGAAKAAAEVAVRGLVPAAAVVRTSLIIGAGDSVTERHVRDLATGRRSGVLFTDDVRCPIHVTDLAAALLEFAARPSPGVHHVAGAEAVSRHRLGVLIARRDGLDESALRTARRVGSGLPGAVDVRLDCRATQRRLVTRLRGAGEFLSL
ncbi:dTDP-4-dehydrorhamnose reductase [Actinoplanes sp. SE50]|uniref:SDR family oxidoreductase n=1 Tax=unclassified Actinoplanes TaxID=2626549 RepID=UPI00023EC0D5|nr:MULTISPECIES: sugar nucleotide-binding protein [unclassified Actinoplanes]AEV84078.1 dTDP-4-dehydrorhamnose reductase [Actinoplanes sp. SE50/110]ATO82470.1 dTDP-4-dehydrorhamnose reductase [Actinoplanes sp. SE50]SLL99877.1 dTDP-4-dehydrorhamnose reductase [Actinoplanes sp. SE50/110]